MCLLKHKAVEVDVFLIYINTFDVFKAFVVCLSVHKMSSPAVSVSTKYKTVFAFNIGKSFEAGLEVRVRSHQV